MALEQIGIVGLGLLGRGIATCFLAKEFHVVAYDIGGETSYVKARACIQAGVDEMIVHAGCAESIANGWKARFTPVQSLGEMASCTFIIESVSEDLSTKLQVFDELEAAVSSDIPIASNTSALPISSLQRSRRHPQRFLGMHWAEPAYATRFLEVIGGEHTSAESIRRTVDLARRIGKDPCVLQKDLPGFIVNRLGYAMYREAVYLLESGIADADTIDRAFRNACGLWASLCGPLRWIDITGGPALYAKAMSGVLPNLNRSPELPQLLAQMHDEGYRGTIDGRGFYPYQTGDDERWHDLLRRQAWAILRLQKEMDDSAAAAGVTSA
jgi:3-hydroxybutyryl-CoA dehydrogenase